MHIPLFFFTQWTCTLYMRSVLWFSSPHAKILWPQQRRTGPHARNGLSLAWLMAATACPLSAATWLWKTKCKHWWICFKWTECKLLTDTCWPDAEKNKIQTKKDTKPYHALHPHPAGSVTVHVIAPARPFPLPASSADDVWDLKLGMPATAGHYCSLRCKWGPPVLITSYCYGYLHTEGLGPFQSFLIESMKQIK